MFSTKSIFQALGLGFVALMFGLFALSIAPAKAEVDGRDQRVVDAETWIRKNQVRIAELKTIIAPLSEELKKLELHNATQVGVLSTYGFNYDWKAAKSVKVSDPL